MTIYTPAKPWTGASASNPIEVSGDNGLLYVAVGPNSLKPAPEPAPEPEPLNHTDGSVVPYDCVQPSLNGPDGLPLPKGTCVAPCETKVCGLTPYTTIRRFTATKLSNTLFSLSDPVLGITGVIGIDPPADRPFLSVSDGASGGTSISIRTLSRNTTTDLLPYNIVANITGVPGRNSLGCPDLIEWQFFVGDLDTDAPSGVASCITMLSPLNGSLSGNFTEDPATPGRYCAEVALGAGGDLGIINSTPQDITQVSVIKYLMEQGPGDTIAFNVRLRHRTAVTVCLDQQGNFIRAFRDDVEYAREEVSYQPN